MKIPNLFEGSRPFVEYTAGTTIFPEGSPAGDMYIVKEGQVELSVRGTVLETVSADDCFGEMCLIENEPRSATATAKTDCKLASINKAQFLFMVKEEPLFAFQIMKVMSRRLRQLDRLLKA